jgi:Fe-S cluster assembly iron-binding protein IscA
VLTISPAASEAIKGLVAASDLPENGGIRISNRPEGPGTFELTLAPEPGEADEVVEHQGATVFLEDEVAQLLDDKTLDAQTQGEQVAFTIVEGGPGNPSAGGASA